MARKAKEKVKEMKFKSDFNIDECYKLTKYFPKYKNKLKLQLALKYLIFSLVFSFVFCFINIMFGIGLFIFLVIGFSAAIFLDFENGAKKCIKSYIKKNKYKDVFENTIKDINISRKNGDLIIEHEGINIEEVVISDNEIFMYDQKYKTYLIFQKRYMNYSIIEYIKDNFKNVKVIKDKDLDNEKIDDNKKRKINLFMVLLFILNLFVPFIAGGATSTLISSHKIITNTVKIQSMFVFWLFLPIPILSIVLGINYKKKGLNTFKNIFIGFVILLYLLIVGCAALLPTYEVDYKKINKYKDIISINLPKYGKLEYKKLKSDDKNIKDYKVYTIYFKSSDASKVIESIKADEAWFSAIELKTYMKIFTNIDDNYYDADYYSIYNKTSDEYNVLPVENGKYEMYVMKYHSNNNTITVEIFTYNYKNKD